MFSEHDISSADIPEWKKLLIMRKRAGNSDEPGKAFPRAPVSSNVNGARNGGYGGDKCAPGHGNKFAAGRPPKLVDSESGSSHDATPPKKVTRTIGNINVELRSVSPKCSIDSPEFCADSSRFPESYPDSDDDDLQYGPGIVDRLRARFLNMGAKKQRKPVVRRFSSLENLPGSHSVGPYRPRGVRQNGKTTGHYPHSHGNVKKAQSMETLLSSTPEEQGVGRRTGSRFGGGVKGRIMAKNASLVCADENDEPDDATSPDKPGKRWEYCRSVSASNINENELPKPDTVKQVKKMFESEKAGSGSVTAGRFRKVARYGNGVSTPAAGKACNGAPLGNCVPNHQSSIDQICEEEAVETAKCNGAKEESSLDIAGAASPIQNSETYRGDSPVSSCDDVLSPANEAPGTLVADDNEAEVRRIEREESEESFIVVEPAKVTHERSPEISPVDEEQISFQPTSREETCGEVEQQTLVAEISEEEDDSGGGETQTVVDGMVVASSAAEDGVQKTWQTVKKPPQSTTSIVFDFRGKDVKPNISLNPTPFGCRPAKVSRRAGSPPRGPDSPDSPPKVNGVKDYLDDYDDDDWDEMDIGADLPAVCGIVFDGENVKVGRGAFLETRNKKLSIQFDDGATSTFEYPSEVSSPAEENVCRTEPSVTLTSPANSRLGLSNYTPHALSSEEDFELGVSRPSPRPLPRVPTDEEEGATPEEELLPEEGAAGWSATETADILF